MDLGEVNLLPVPPTSISYEIKLRWDKMFSNILQHFEKVQAEVNNSHRQIERTQAAVMDKIKIQQELKSTLARVTQEVEDERINHHKLLTPQLEIEEKKKSRVTKCVKALQVWKSTAKDVEAKLKKSKKQTERYNRILDTLGITLVSNPDEVIEKVEGADRLSALQFTKINPNEPDAAYFVYFTAFNTLDWSFQVSAAQPNFKGFEEMSKRVNESGDLLDLIVNCRKGWLKEISRTCIRKLSPDIFDDEEELSS